MINLPRLLIIAAALLAAACSMLPAPTPVIADAGSDNWQIRGKVGVWAGDTRESVGVLWLQCGDSLRIDFSGAIGGTAARLSGDAAGVWLQQAGKPDRSAPDADTLLAELGWPMPASALRWWMFANPVPDNRSQAKLNGDGQLRALDQLGWHIEYDAYEVIGGREVPGIVDLRRADVRFRIIAADYDLTPEDCQVR